MPEEDNRQESALRRGIQSIEIGVGILKVMAGAPGPMSLKEIAGKASLPASNCHRYLVSFARTGFVTQNARTGRYDLGPALLQSGLAALGRVDSLGIALDTLEQLVDETDHTGMVVIWAEAGPTIVRWMQGRLAVHTTLAPGATLPLLTTATGQVFLAFLPPRQTAALRRIEAGRSPSGAHLPSDNDSVRRERLAQVSGDHIPGLNAAASPILDASGEAAAVLTMLSAGKPLSDRALAALRHHCAIASGRLGWVAPGVSDAA